MVGFGLGTAEVFSARRQQKLSLYLTEPMPAGSKMYLPLAKSEPISSDGSTCYRKKKKENKKLTVFFSLNRLV